MISLAEGYTRAHDASAYRYQRIGMSLFAALSAKLFLQDWVSPTWYFVSYFLLLVFATFVGGNIFKNIGSNPSLILFWSFSVGTQVTLFNALPDAAADGFMILAIAALLKKKICAVYNTFYILSIIQGGLCICTCCDSFV